MEWEVQLVYITGVWLVNSEKWRVFDQKWRVIDKKWRVFDKFWPVNPETTVQTTHKSTKKTACGQEFRQSSKKQHATAQNKSYFTQNLLHQDEKKEGAEASLF
ncbi:hypothetical protein [Fictibacillus fluitans]|uniref:Uncharacterized protein n=1 Tax=Fictibacillus fluitans TaxID=3058422 RepID=A0ABT8I412_9BACL|nr:hypothetical protein [Fictibacillus sp. NE201]MDN4527450.1 hypothetical protein [Fictibacillus sp. NE201]